MKHIKNILITVAGLILFSLTLPSNVYGYLDPGTGSYFLQLIAAALVGSLFAIKLYWKKIKTSFKEIFSKKKKIGKN
jgi:hypothetical protein